MYYLSHAKHKVESRAQGVNLINASLEDRKSLATVADAVAHEKARSRWERKYGAPASITGASSAITCVRRGLPICSVVLNYITQHLAVACSSGIYWLDLKRSANGKPRRGEVDVEYLRDNAERISFPQEVQERDRRRFVTFLGKEGYKPNFADSELVRPEEWKECLHYRFPGGPSRILYLSDLQTGRRPVGFIVANGEKIGEWIHWLTFVRFATMPRDARESALHVFEISQERPWTRDGILMATSPVYSIFRVVDGKTGRMVIDIDRLQAFPNPSKYRSTLLVAPATNDWAMQLVQVHGRRPIQFVGD